MLKSVHFRSLLSFGARSEPLELRPLNVLIGPNGCGKTNLIEGIGLLRAAPRNLPDAVRDAGGAGPLFWNGKGPAELAAVLDRAPKGMRHSMRIRQEGASYALDDERIENAVPNAGHPTPFFYFGWEGGRPMFNLRVDSSQGYTERRLVKEDLDPQRSVLEQRKDPVAYPELDEMAQFYAQIRIYRNWAFGRRSPPRLPQATDLPGDHVDEDATNLALVLQNLRNTKVKKDLIAHVREIFKGADDYSVSIVGNTAQLILQEFMEGGEVFSTSATRLSDGTIRWLALLAILLDPDPPQLVCIDEPELGLHPDLIGLLAKLLVDASERMQLIVTTHSDILIDALTDTPEAVLVCERDGGETLLRRLDPKDLATWLEEYSLGGLWLKGHLGGNRW